LNVLRILSERPERVETKLVPSYRVWPLLAVEHRRQRCWRSWRAWPPIGEPWADPLLLLPACWHWLRWVGFRI